MRIPPVAVASLAAAALAVIAGVAAAPARARESSSSGGHAITLEAGGPLAFIEVTRTLPPPAEARLR